MASLQIETGLAISEWALFANEPRRVVQVARPLGAASACVFSHREKRIVTTVHGDDFTSSGPKCSLDWLREQLKSKYELVEQSRLSPGPQDDVEARVLNRIVRRTPEGL